MGDLGPIPGSGRSGGGRHGNPLQYSCLENPTDRGAWRTTESDKSLTWLSDQAQHSTIGWHQVKGLWDSSALFFETVYKSTIISNFNLKKCYSVKVDRMNRQAGDWGENTCKNMSNSTVHPEYEFSMINSSIISNSIFFYWAKEFTIDFTKEDIYDIYLHEDVQHH